MDITLAELEAQQKDHFRARWEGEQLVMEPHCYCGEPVDEEYSCPACQHKCRCTFIACEDDGALAAVSKLFRENPDFHKFGVGRLSK